MIHNVVSKKEERLFKIRHEGSFEITDDDNYCDDNYYDDDCDDDGCDDDDCNDDCEVFEMMVGLVSWRYNCQSSQ